MWMPTRSEFHTMTETPASNTTTTETTTKDTSSSTDLGAPSPTNPATSLSHITYDPEHPAPPPYQNPLFQGTIDEFLSALSESRELYFGRLSGHPFVGAVHYREWQLWDLATRTGYTCENVIASRDKFNGAPLPRGKEYAFVRMTCRTGSGIEALRLFSDQSTVATNEANVTHLDLVEPNRRLFVGWDLGFAEGIQFGADTSAPRNFSGAPRRGGFRGGAPPYHQQPYAGGYQQPPYGGGVPRDTLRPQRGEKRYREGSGSDQYGDSTQQRKRRRFES